MHRKNKSTIKINVMAGSLIYQIGLGIVVGFIFLIIFLFLVSLLTVLLFGNITVNSLTNLTPNLQKAATR